MHQWVKSWRTAGSRRRSIVAALAISLFAVACVPEPGAPGVTTPAGPPSISGFEAQLTRTAAPALAVFRWTIDSGGNTPALCRVDVNGDGLFDREVTPCRSIDTVLASIDAQGTITATLEVSAGGYVPVTRTVTFNVGPVTNETFNIDLDLDPAMQPAFRTQFEAAAQRWEEVLAVGVGDVPMSLPPGLFGWVGGFAGTVDDLRIAARVTAIDGESGILGRAGPVLIREGGKQPYFGVMEFDEADFLNMDADGTLFDVILHEMGHVLGLGSTWATSGLIQGLIDPQYTGGAAVAAYQQLGGSHFVPVENEGGVGTALSHWRESTFDDELMTGYLGWTPGEPLSILSISALADLGYGVDLQAADAYILPSKRFGLQAGLFGLLGPLSAGHDHDAAQHSEPITPFLDGLPDPLPAGY